MLKFLQPAPKAQPLDSKEVDAEYKKYACRSLSESLLVTQLTIC